jgi:hypothetical protein
MERSGHYPAVPVQLRSQILGPSPRHHPSLRPRSRSGRAGRVSVWARPPIRGAHPRHVWVCRGRPNQADRDTWKQCNGISARAVDAAAAVLLRLTRETDGPPPTSAHAADRATMPHAATGREPRASTPLPVRSQAASNTFRPSTPASRGSWSECTPTRHGTLSKGWAMIQRA